MTILVLDGDLVGDALEALSEDELIIVIEPSAARLEALRERFPDSHITWLIGDNEVIPIPDGSVDRVLGEGSESEIARVLK
jgi:ubiquinone/menaquinone biosynthesis C-methylase UbiE